MRGRSYFCFLSVLVVLAGQLSARAHRESAPRRGIAATVRFDLYRDYLIVVPGSSGSLNGLHFLLDTGASPTVLDRRLARRLQLEEKPVSISVLGGRAQAGEAIVPSLQFGPIRKDNFPVLTEDLSFLQKALPVHVDAVIGLDMLDQGTFEVDYRSREIRFGQPSALPISIPFRMEGGLPIIDAELNHAAVHLLVDTGASSLFIFETRALAPVSGPETDPTQRLADLIGQFDYKQIWLHSLRLGNEEFRQEPAFVVRDRPDEGQHFDGLMSPVALGITRVAVDFERGVLAFSR